MATPQGTEADLIDLEAPREDGSESEYENAQNKSNRFFEEVDVMGKERKIVIFGETGAGKSSIIRMLSNSNDAQDIPVSNHPVGCTPQSTSYPITIDDEHYTIWDTAGLSEAEAGTVPADVALDHLRDLVENLSTDGISLLLYCIRWSRYRKILKVNYDLFSEIICGGQVPIVAVITGLENEESMEGWWKENEVKFEKEGMVFQGHACVTATKGKQSCYEAEYEESVLVMKEVIRNQCSGKAWRLKSGSGVSWLADVSSRMENYTEYNHSRGSTEDDELTRGINLLKSGISCIARYAFKKYRKFERAVGLLPSAIESPPSGVPQSAPYYSHRSMAPTSDSDPGTWDNDQGFESETHPRGHPDVD